MNLTSLFCVSALTLAACALPSIAAPQAGNSAEAPASFVRPQLPYTILSVKAMSHRDSAEGEYDHTIVLRFHRDSNKVDIKVLAPGEKRDGWGPLDECGTYEPVTSATAMDCDEETFNKARLHYKDAVEDDCNDLQLHIVSIGKMQKSGKCKVRLIASSYTYILGGGSKLFTYEFADDATIWASR